MSELHSIRSGGSAGGVAQRSVSWPRIPLHLVRPSASAAIVGGSDASQGQFPFMAFVLYAESSTSYLVCSGTVVSPNVVLTAGHCGVDESTGVLLDPSKFSVVTGSADWTNSAVRQVSPVSRVIVDPAYDRVMRTSDAALLVLATPTTAPSVRLAGSGDLNLETAGTGGVIAGWGETVSGSGTVPYTLQWAVTVVQSPAYCGTLLASFDAGKQLCAVNYPYGDTGTCNGDSGGPLIAADAAGQPVEIGITSLGPLDCNTVSGDIFTSVAPVTPWINQQIAAAEPSPPPPTTTTTTPTTTTPPPTTPSAPKLPRMTLSQARSLARQTLAGVLRAAFKHEHAYQAQCSRTSSTRFDCGFTFWSGPNDYYGSVSVYYVSGAGGRTYWSDRYTTRWVNDHCYYHSGARQRCKIHVKRGTW
jgi:hypothetical protein